MQKDCWEINVSAYVTVDLKFFLKLWIRHNAIAAHDTNHVLKSVHAVLEKMLIVDLLFFFLLKLPCSSSLSKPAAGKSFS